MAAIAALVNWLLTFGRNWLTWLYNALVDLINGAISGFCSWAMFVVSLFPEGSPVPVLPSNDADPSLWSHILIVLNWLFPLGYYVQLFVWVLVAMVLYVAIAPLARWLKLLT